MTTYEQQIKFLIGDVDTIVDSPLDLAQLYARRLSFFRVYEGIVPDVDGFEAPLGCFLLLIDTFEIWQKSGPLITDWTEFTSGGGGGATTFKALTDTPANYTGAAKKIPVVNDAANGLIYSPATIDSNGNIDAGEISMKVYSQIAEPALTADNRMAIWIDIDDGNRTYLIYRRGAGDQLSVELG